MTTPATPTPRTDAKCLGSLIHTVDADFARTLETELQAATQRIAELEGDLARAKASDENNFAILKKAHEKLEMTNEQSYSLIPGEIEEWICSHARLKDRIARYTDPTAMLIVEKNKLETELAASRAECERLKANTNLEALAIAQGWEKQLTEKLDQLRAELAICTTMRDSHGKQLNAANKNEQDVENTRELFRFLLGHVPEGYAIEPAHLPKLTPDQAEIVIWFLGNKYWQVTDHVERCGVCGEWYNTESEGKTLDFGQAPYCFCGECYEGETAQRKRAKLNEENP